MATYYNKTINSKPGDPFYSWVCEDEYWLKRYKKNSSYYARLNQ